MIRENYKLQAPIIDLETLKSIIPKYGTIPLWWDDSWYLFYLNIWGKVCYMSPQGQGELSRRRFFLYKNKPQSEFVVEEREYRKWECFENEIITTYHCPNCNEDLVPYDYDFERQLIGHLTKVEYCPDCGYPLLW